MYIQYLIPKHHDILVRPLLTVPDAPDGEYQFAGVPDGIGAFALPGTDNGFEIVLTHELRFNAGRRRAHASSGAFVSRWQIDTTHWNDERGKGRIGVVSGRDQIQAVHHWQHAGGGYRTSRSVPIERLCSADLPVTSALYFKDEKGTEYGTTERIFLGAEETHTRFKSDHGRAFAHVLTGPREGHTYELPHLGRGSYENALACPKAGRKTIVILPDDAESHRVYDTEKSDDPPRSTPDPCAAGYDHYRPPSEMYVYVGEKMTHEDAKNSSMPLELAQAGLVGGKLYGIQVVREGEPINWEHREFGFGQTTYEGEAEFRLIDLGDRSKAVALPPETKDGDCEPLAQDNPGIALQRDSIRLGVTQFLRPEDGAWDPRPKPHHEHDQVFYFGTTDQFDGNSRLFRLTFYDCDSLGEDDLPCGTIEIVLNARVNPEDKSSDAEYLFHSLDSMGIDPWGRVLLQEDPGDEAYRTRTLVYTPDRHKLYAVAEGNFDLFDRRGSHFLTTNEEAAGILPVFDLLGEGWYLTAVQANVETDWASKVVPGLLTYNEQLQMETDLVTPGQLCAIFIPEVLSDELEVKPAQVTVDHMCEIYEVDYAGRKLYHQHGD
ncbi:hypothetical protein Mal52_13330 [Symmachiella dynata]|uniref:Uncharacterized protein n=1 Tax=Symmachiella dynata TaxID=2527995 RepID=A0A517ZK38_9PLAN|nr:hypothetical protein [Symmachiella dynata]QDU42864.1 hypothetical protein Mal52_13330 [Symmachiella dynata]